MSPAELLLLAFALAMDAVAVSLALGLRLRRPSARDAGCAATVFGLFQGLMALLGWGLASWSAEAVSQVAPWIAFTLLVLIGLNMLREAAAGEAAEESTEALGASASQLSVLGLLPLGVATSIDSAAAGVTFGVLEVEVAPAAALIGAVTFALSLLAVAVGARVGERLGSRAEVLGGVVLIVIGLRVLLDHLGVL